MNVILPKEFIQEAKDICVKSHERRWVNDIERELSYAVRYGHMAIPHCLIEKVAKLTEQVALTRLRIDDEDATTLSPSIGKFRDLKVLDLMGMFELTALPEEIGSLENLEWLRIRSYILEVPDSLTKLQQLNLLSRAQLQRRYPNLRGDWIDRGYKTAPEVNDDIVIHRSEHYFTRVNDHFAHGVIRSMLWHTNFEKLTVESGEAPEVQGYYRFSFKFIVPIKVYNIFFENFMLRYARDPKLGREFEENALAFLGQSLLFEKLAEQLTAKLKEKEVKLPEGEDERLILFREALVKGKIWYDEAERVPVLDIKSTFFRWSKFFWWWQVGDYQTVHWKRNRAQQLHKSGFS